MRPRLAASLLLLACSLGVGLAARQPARDPSPVFDLVIANARILDGAGSPWFRARSACAATRSRPSPRGSTRQPSVASTLAGQVLAPGFIDIHTHARRGIFDVPTADNYVRQGVTTIVEGPDGSSPLPMATS